MRRLTMAMCFLAQAGIADAAPHLSGIWLMDHGQAAIDLHGCDDDLCGYIAWLRDPKDEAGQPLLDDNNPDQSQRGRTLCGVQVIGGLRAQTRDWQGGWIYDPEEGKRYDVAIEARGSDEILVTGFIAVKALGRTLVWHRAPANLQRCVNAARQNGQ